MSRSYFIIQFNETPEQFQAEPLMLDDCNTAWFGSYADAKLTGDDLCGELDVDYIICEKPQ
jgi:hypothetical protein